MAFLRSSEAPHGAYYNPEGQFFQPKHRGISGRGRLAEPKKRQGRGYWSRLEIPAGDRLRQKTVPRGIFSELTRFHKKLSAAIRRDVANSDAARRRKRHFIFHFPRIRKTPAACAVGVDVSIGSKVSVQRFKGAHRRLSFNNRMSRGTNASLSVNNSSRPLNS